MLAAAVMFALTAVAHKALTRTESVLSILFWMNLIQLPLNLVAGRVFRLCRSTPSRGTTRWRWRSCASPG